MDRWIDADDDISARSRGPPQGRVARLGLAGFVQSQGSLGTENAKTFGKIEVVQSKRDQRKAEATRLMPPPRLPGGTATEAPTPVPEDVPSIPSLPAATGPPKCPVPDWAAEPTAGSRLLVYKDGQAIQEVPLVKIVTVFGRVDALADVVLDHPSISRQHATAAFHGARGTWMITDLGSTHGTFLGDRQLAKNDPTELVPGVELRFAASTRRYKLPPAPPGPQSRNAAVNAGGVAAAPGSESGRLPSATAAASAMEMPPPPPPKRPRVCFADDTDAGGHSGGGGEDGKPATLAAAGRPRQLENIIGFSDGRDFVARVGPRAAAPAEGRFAGAVATTIVLSPKGPSASAAAATAQRASSNGSGEAVASGGGGGGGGGGGNSPRPHSSVHGGAGAPATGEVRPQLRELVDRIRKETPRGGGGTLYEQLPPPSR
ncbi:hypothetical protein VaNZ11_003639 [Volvox africanus]|uniref:FHA domain-containing protein n=1 Tax=Volvox africanus TaxID=51714 RepID=A0ABQ5RVQ1_9CHLO|nr:hypothetical protein VaNZ11_003639 [Volvox africanus]